MSKRRLTLTALVLGLSLLSAVPNAKAGSDLKTPEDASAQEVVDGFSTKLVRGVANVATGWLEFPKQIYLTTKHDGAVKGMAVGPVKGIGMTVARTVTGALEIATFLLPYPGFYDPFFDPAYVWEKE